MSDNNSDQFSAHEEIAALADFLKSKHPDNLLIPLRSGTKSPAMTHKGGRFTWRNWSACMANRVQYTEFGLLVRTMVVVDADSPEAVSLLEGKYPALHECPCVQTRKGKHYYFLRSSLCEEKNVTDSTGIWEKVDLKTVTNSWHEHESGNGKKIATAGVVVVPPSKNKSWVRSIIDTPLKPIPDEIIRDMLASKDCTQKKRKTPGVVAERSQHQVEPPNDVIQAVVDRVRYLLRQVCGDSTSVFDKVGINEENVWSLYFRNGPDGRKCPGGYEHCSNNFYVHWYQDGSCYYYCLGSECHRHFLLGTCIAGKGVPPPSQLASLEDTLGLLRNSLAPSRFENLNKLAGAVKSCFGKNSFHVFEQLVQGAASCPSAAHLEEAFVSSRSSGDAGMLKRWAKEDCPGNWNQLQYQHLGPPSTEDKVAAQALLTHAKENLGFEFLYCSPGVQFFWDGERFQDNGDDAYTCQTCLKYGEKIAKIYNISSTMYSKHGKIKNICGVLKGLTVDRDAHGKMNQNTKLLGFDDGVLELESGVFRPRRFSDYITMSVGYSFPGKRDKAAEAEVMAFFEQVHCDPDIREFVLYRLASCLEGHNTDEKGPMWTGASGANGKSKMAELMKMTMGDYGGTLESSQLTTARSSGTANSQLASVMFRRFLVVEEPDTMCKSWNWEKFKEITGRGEVQVRELYERPISMMPHFTPILIFNSLPEGCTKVDKAVQRRLEVIPFESEFVHDPTMPHQFPIDVHLSGKFASWKEHLFNILYYDYYRKYILTGRPIRQPDQCKHTADSIMDMGQVVRNWFEERVVPDPKGVLTLSEAKDDFYTDWINATGFRCDGIKLREFKEQLCGLLNRRPQEQMCNALTNNIKVTNVWIGCRLGDNPKCEQPLEPF